MASRGGRAQVSQRKMGVTTASALLDPRGHEDDGDSGSEHCGIQSEIQVKSRANFQDKQMGSILNSLQLQENRR